MIKKMFVLGFLIFAAACGTQKSPLRQKPLVFVSIAPYQEIVQRIGGTEIDVETIVPQGANPHSFEPTSKQAAHMSQAVLWFRIGEPFEKKLVHLLNGRDPSLAIIDLRDQVHLIEEEGLCSHCGVDHQDRHIWMSPKETQIQAKEIARALEKRFPEKKEVLKKNLDLLLLDLQNLDQQIRTVMQSAQNRTILVSHPAFGYFCRDYDCHQISVEYEGKEPRPKHVQEISSLAKGKKVKVALSLPQYNNKGAQLIAKNLQVPVRMIDPYSSQYFETLLKMAHLVATPDEPS